MEGKILEDFVLEISLSKVTSKLREMPFLDIFLLSEPQSN